MLCLAKAVAIVSGNGAAWIASSRTSHNPGRAVPTHVEGLRCIQSAMASKAIVALADLISESIGSWGDKMGEEPNKGICGDERKRGTNFTERLSARHATSSDLGRRIIFQLGFRVRVSFDVSQVVTLRTRFPSLQLSRSVRGAEVVRGAEEIRNVPANGRSTPASIVLDQLAPGHGRSS